MSLVLVGLAHLQQTAGATRAKALQARPEAIAGLSRPSLDRKWVALLPWQNLPTDGGTSLPSGSPILTTRAQLLALPKLLRFYALPRLRVELESASKGSRRAFANHFASAQHLRLCAFFSFCEATFDADSTNHWNRTVLESSLLH